MYQTSHSTFEPTPMENIELNDIEIEASQTMIQIRKIRGVVGVFLSPNKKKIPVVFGNSIAKIHAIPEIVIFLHVERRSTPFVSNEGKIEVKQYGDHIYKMNVNCGYAEGKVNIAHALKEAEQLHLINTHNLPITYYIDRNHIEISTKKITLRYSLLDYTHSLSTHWVEYQVTSNYLYLTL